MVLRAQRPRGLQSERFEFQYLGAPLFILSSVFPGLQEYYGGKNKL